MKTLAVLGAGLRGQYAYASYTLTHPEVKIVAVADLNPQRVKTFQTTYQLPDSACFSSGEAMLAAGKLADAIIIASMDQDHYAHTIQAIELGYDILLEKPISPSLTECLEIEAKALQKGVKIVVCHVLRYTPFYRQIKQIIKSGILGRIINIEAMENVAHWHQAHSFVRGNWRHEKTSSPMILQKCCHDMDIYAWLLESKVDKIHSFGDLTYFKSEHAPIGAPTCCLDDCPSRDTCPYDVYKIYLSDNLGWPVSAISADSSYQARYHALQTSAYGNCVFHSDNDVVDHQTINCRYENGVTMVFTMTAFTQACDRTLRLMGTKGELKASMDEGQVLVTDFLSGKTEVIKIEGDEKGHGGGDFGIMEEFVAVINNQLDNSNPISASVHAHVVALAAEASRHQNKLITINDFLLNKSML